MSRRARIKCAVVVALVIISVITSIWMIKTKNECENAFDGKWGTALRQ